MKIGILTFHFAHNYGAMLQAYALNKYLCEKGKDCQIIDYRLPYIYDSFERLSFSQIYNLKRKENSSIIAFLKAIKNYKKLHIRTKRWNRFNKFHETYFKQTKRVYSTFDINNLVFDTFILGSDQIWNETLTGELIPLYFGAGLNTNDIISYAGSNGRETVPEKFEKEFLSLIQNVKHISVRERGLQEFLASKDINTTLVCDPVFLLSKSQWQSLAKKRCNEKYILVYSFLESPDFFEILDKIHYSLNLKVIYICYWKKEGLKSYIEQSTDNGPIEFLTLFANASFVVTNSFHGTAFSLMFEKQFITVPPTINQERVYSLLESLSLSDRVVKTIDSTIPNSVIDYSLVMEKLDCMTKVSKDFLSNSL